MDQMSQKTLDMILAKPMQEINEYDVSILRARKSYLSDDQLKQYAQFLEDKVVSIEEMKFTELKALCVQRGIDVPTTVKSKEAILALIAEAEEKEDKGSEE